MVALFHVAATVQYLGEKTMSESDYQLDPEEQEILEAFEQGILNPIPDAEAHIQEAKAIARNTLNKTKRINLRLTERDYQLAHVRAIEEGLPYQTLLSSVIHKYLTGRLVDASPRPQS